MTSEDKLLDASEQIKANSDAFIMVALHDNKNLIWTRAKAGPNETIAMLSAVVSEYCKRYKLTPEQVCSWLLGTIKSAQAEMHKRKKYLN